jgi:hypothetical protein
MRKIIPATALALLLGGSIGVAAGRWFSQEAVIIVYDGGLMKNLRVVGATVVIRGSGGEINNVFFDDQHTGLNGTLPLTVNGNPENADAICAFPATAAEQLNLRLCVPGKDAGKAP